MASGPDLFVVCKNCGAEVSPYITECPYCGSRLRKRAPKLEKGGVPKPPRARRAPRPSLGRMRPGEMPGIRLSSGRPYATILLILIPVLVTLGWRATLWNVDALAIDGPIGERYWQLVTTTFVYRSTGYEVVALSAIALFGWLLGRRHGGWATLLVYLLGSAAGFGTAVLVEESAFALGGNAPALALLGAWAARDLLARRRGEEDESDLLGALVFAAVLVLVPLAQEEAHALAGLVGGVTGLVLGLILARLPER